MDNITTVTTTDYVTSKELLIDCEEIESTKSFEIQHCDIQNFLDCAVNHKSRVSHLKQANQTNLSSQESKVLSRKSLEVTIKSTHSNLKTNNNPQKTLNQSHTTTAAASHQSSSKNVVQHPSAKTTLSLSRLRNENIQQAETIQILLEEKKTLLKLVQKLQEHNHRLNIIITRIQHPREVIQFEQSKQLEIQKSPTNHSLSPDLSRSSNSHFYNDVSKPDRAIDQSLQMITKASSQIINPTFIASATSRIPPIYHSSHLRFEPAKSASSSNLMQDQNFPLAEKSSPLLNSYTYVSPSHTNERDFWSSGQESASTCVSALSPTSNQLSSDYKHPSTKSPHRRCDLPTSEDPLFLPPFAITKEDVLGRLSLPVRPVADYSRLQDKQIRNNHQSSAQNHTSAFLTRSFEQENNNYTNACNAKAVSALYGSTAAFQTFVNSKSNLSTNLPSKVHENFHKLLSRSYTKPTTVQQQNSSQLYQTTSSTSSTTFPPQDLFFKQQKMISAVNSPLIIDEVSPRLNNNHSITKIQSFFTKQQLANNEPSFQQQSRPQDDQDCQVNESSVHSSAAITPASHQHSSSVLHSFQQSSQIVAGNVPTTCRLSSCNIEPQSQASHVSFSSRLPQQPMHLLTASKNFHRTEPSQTVLTSVSMDSHTPSRRMNQIAAISQQQQTLADIDENNLQLNQSANKPISSFSNTYSTQQQQNQSHSHFSNYSSLLLPLPQSKKQLITRSTNELQKQLYNSVSGYSSNHFNVNHNNSNNSTMQDKSYYPPPRSHYPQHILKPSNINRREMPGISSSAAALQKLTNASMTITQSSCQNSSRRSLISTATAPSHSSGKSSTTLNQSGIENVNVQGKYIQTMTSSRNTNKNNNSHNDEC